MARLLLVRHGAVQAADPPLYLGHADVPLSSEGVQQVEKLCERLAGEEIAAIYTSDLRRAADTAATIAVAHQVPVILCADLREIDFGLCEGLTYDEIAVRYPEALEVWGRLDVSVRFPGGESFAALAERVDRFVALLSKLEQRQTALIVAHGGSLRVLLCRLLGIDLSHWWQFSIEPASVTVVQRFPEGSVLTLANDLSHLASLTLRVKPTE